ncbi:hypothetical protein BGX21_011513 [Mortierella sp. AD011]|nr:hypothetical protein BGX20_002894 [Mortierella sp. AD010]KAF9402022.1 hypothetical protein BGX21_011513 [Mortierella sp. AD011]
MTIAFFAVDPQYSDGTDLSLIPPPHSQPSTSTTIVIWRLVAIANNVTPKGLYIPIEKSLVVNAFDILFPQLSTSCTAGPDLQRIETCLANPDTFTLFLATETTETIFFKTVPRNETDAVSASSVAGDAGDVPPSPPRISFKISKIVGCLTLITLKLLMKSRAHIEDVVVSNDCRGQGIGRGLMKRALHDAVHIRGCEIVDLTSRPDRIQARALYESLGFKLRDTGSFRYNVPS